MTDDTPPRAGQEAAHPVRGCLYDILGFALGAAVVIAAVMSAPARLLAPTPGDAPGAAAVCVAPFMAVVVMWLMARRWLILRLPAAFVLGVYAAALGAAVVALALR